MRANSILKKVAIIATATAIIFGSVATPIKAEAKGTAFINKKVTSVTPTVKSAKRNKLTTTVTVSVPASKVKKLGNVKKVTVAYGSTKNSKKFEAKKTTAKVTKKGTNQYTFKINNPDVATYKNAYITVRFNGKSNWSKLVKVSGKAARTHTNYVLECNDCHKRWTGTTSIEELEAKFNKHCDDSQAAWDAKYLSQCKSFEDMAKFYEKDPYCTGGYSTWETTAYY